MPMRIYQSVHTALKICILAFIVATSGVNASGFTKAAYTAHLIAQEGIAMARSTQFKDAVVPIIKQISRHDSILDDVSSLLEQGVSSSEIAVVYDIDDCVTYPYHAACLPCSYAAVHKDAFQRMLAPLDFVQQSIVWNLLYRETESRLTDDQLPNVLRTLADEGIQTFGLTASMAGAVKDDDDVQHSARHQILADLGIRFNAPDAVVHFEDFEKFHKSHPFYYNGIGFAQTSMDYGSTTKGEFFIELLKKLSLNKSYVLFIDDSKNNLIRFSHIMQEYGIACTPYQFRSDRVHAVHEITTTEFENYISNLIAIARSATSTS